MRHLFYAFRGIKSGHRMMAYRGFLNAMVEVYKKAAGKKITARIPQYLINLKKRF